MAQTRRKRRTKHRGTAAGTVQARGRTSKPLSTDERKKVARAQAREERMMTPPTWKRAIKNGVFAAVTLFLVVLLFLHPKKGNPIGSALVLCGIALLFYIPGGYWFETMLYRRRLAKRRQQARR